MSRLPIAALTGGTGFVSDTRFVSSEPAPPPPPDPNDLIAQAWEEGYAVGRAEAEAEAQAAASLADAARQRIELALAHLDDEQGEALRQKLVATVEALCETTIAPLALDRDALASRVARAAEMLMRADDDKLLRLHPDDLALVGARLPEGLAVEPDPTLERGALRLESQHGGVEDGPQHWRRAIAEALTQC